MPVNINEFEVVVDAPQQNAGAAQPPTEPPPAPRGATPHEIEGILRREKDRLARVRAF